MKNFKKIIAEFKINIYSKSHYGAQGKENIFQILFHSPKPFQFHLWKIS